MRDMVFKNLTSMDKRKRVLWASETFNEDGILTKIHKYLIYIIKEVPVQEDYQNEKPDVFVLKCRDTREKTEKFHIRMKGGIYCLAKGKCFFVSFCHTLKIDLCRAPEEARP
ncbi:MAG: hypothetical protein PHH75_02405 [Candidatus Omnitrophica bacterium]|nr:hypothetical protein [Candidatus Omnitrophota bacterium]MDD5574010.1 hypothetical protein [Candidatus Omnitrophota bacterium]